MLPERVADGDGFAAAGGIPIEQIERDLCAVAVGQIEIDGEVAVRVVSRSDLRGCASGGLERARIAGGSRPGVLACAGDADFGVGWSGGGFVGDEIAIAAISAGPHALGCACRGRCKRRKTWLRERGAEEQAGDHGVASRRS